MSFFANVARNRFVRFVFAGGISVVFNVVARAIFSLFFSYQTAIVLAYIVGMVVAWSMMKITVFVATGRRVDGEIVRFVFVNAIGLIQVELVSSNISGHLERIAGSRQAAETLAHIAGLGTLVITSYMLHSRFTYAKKTGVNVIGTVQLRRHVRSQKIPMARFLQILLGGSVLFAVVLNVQLILSPISAGLDPSWVQAIGFAQLHGYRFGDDISFTVGPLFNVLYSNFEGYYSSTIIVFKILYILSVFTAIMSATPWIFPLAFFVASMVLPVSPDALSLIFIFSCYFCFTRAHSISALSFGVILIGLSVISLAKFSNILPTVAILLLADVHRCATKRAPFVTPAFFLVSLGVAATINVYPSELISYVRSGLIVSSGYSEAMNINGSTSEIIWWLIFSIYLLFAYYAMEKRIDKSNIARFTCTFLAAACILFMCFKHGFVRHDGHSLIAWTTLTFLYLFTIATSPVSNISLRVIGIVITACVFVQTEMQYMQAQSWSVASSVKRIAASERDFASLYSFVFFRSGWMSDLTLADDAAKQAIAKEAPFPPLPGTVDMIVNEQSSLIASGAMFTPRPTIQEHGAYSPQLIERNGAFFSGKSAPDFLVFGLGSIDNRHPAFSEGPHWLTFLSRYEPEFFVRNLLILKKRADPVEASLSYETKASVEFGASTRPPISDDAYFVKIKLNKTLIGRMLSFGFKMPSVEIRTDYDDGTATTYRLIPGMAEEGAILVPTVENSSDFAQLYMGKQGLQNLKRPQSFEVLTSKWGKLAYENAIAISYSRVNFPKIDLSEDARLFVERIYKNSRWQREVFELNARKPPMLERSAEGIFAHAPSALRFKTEGVSYLKVSFGMRDGSWTAGAHTDGVCFAVRAGDRTLNERCLDPVHISADRGEQSFTVAIPGGSEEVSMETTCRATCDWDWSYWSNISSSKD